MEEYEDIEYPLLEDEWGEEMSEIKADCTCGYFCMSCLGMCWFDFL